MPMSGLVFALIVFCIVILVVSIFYISRTLRHKERMALLEKDKDPDFFANDTFFLGAAKAGLLLLGAGIGFLIAFLLHYYLFPGNAGEAVFPPFIFMGAGLGLLFFYKKFKP